MRKKIAEITEPDFNAVPDATGKKAVGYTFHEIDPANGDPYLGYNLSEQLRFHLPYRLQPHDHVTLSIPRDDATRSAYAVQGKLALVAENKQALQLVDAENAVVKTNTELTALFAERLRIIVTPPALQKPPRRVHRKI